MNPEAFAKEIAKYQVVRRSDYCKSRVTTGNVSCGFSNASGAALSCTLYVVKLLPGAFFACKVV